MEFELEPLEFINTSKRRRLKCTKTLDPITVKLTIVGDQFVGKTSIIMAYIYNKFGTNWTNPTGSKTEMKRHRTPIYLNNTCYDLRIYDSEEFKEQGMTNSRPYEETDGFILCYAVNNKSSFTNIENQWLPELSLAYPTIPVILVAAKCDLEKHGPDAVLRECEVENLYLDNRISRCIRCSAKTREGLEYVFIEAITVVAESKKSRHLNPLLCPCF